MKILGDLGRGWGLDNFGVTLRDEEVSVPWMDGMVETESGSFDSPTLPQKPRKDGAPSVVVRWTVGLSRAYFLIADF